jgi:hemerythrin-like domain-containing protein
MLQEVEADAIMARAQVEVAAATYLVYYGNHIAKEEEDVLPLAAQILTPEDWKAVKEVQLPGNTAEGGVHTLERFRELRHRIEMEA